MRYDECPLGCFTMEQHQAHMAPYSKPFQHLSAASPPVAAAAQGAVAEQPGWQGIESAPLGTTTLLYSAHNGRMRIDDWGDYARFNQPRITHWHPLPAPPKEPGDEDKMGRERDGAASNVGCGHRSDRGES